MLYDHEQERQRRVADWGGDDVFATNPRRRFNRAERRAGHHALEPAAARARLHEAPHHAEAGLDRLRPERRHADQLTAAGPADELLADAHDDDDSAHMAADAVAGTSAAGSRYDVDPPAGEPQYEVESSGRDSRYEADAERTATGRRTVLVTGRPGPAWTPTRTNEARRRRPAPTVSERIGGRPDRVAAWAFGLGLLLILIAVSTADAAAL